MHSFLTSDLLRRCQCSYGYPVWMNQGYAPRAAKKRYVLLYQQYFCIFVFFFGFISMRLPDDKHYCLRVNIKWRWSVVYVSIIFFQSYIVIAYCGHQLCQSCLQNMISDIKDKQTIRCRESKCKEAPLLCLTNVTNLPIDNILQVFFL